MCLPGTNTTQGDRGAKEEGGWQVLGRCKVIREGEAAEGARKGHRSSSTSPSLVTCRVQMEGKPPCSVLQSQSSALQRMGCGGGFDEHFPACHGAHVAPLELAIRASSWGLFLVAAFHARTNHEGIISKHKRGSAVGGGSIKPSHVFASGPIFCLHLLRRNTCSALGHRPSGHSPHTCACTCMQWSREEGAPVGSPFPSCKSARAAASTKSQWKARATFTG